MADRVDNNLRIGEFVENQIRIRWHAQPANNRIIGANTDIGVHQEQIDDVLYAPLYPLAPCWEWAAIYSRIELRSASAGRV